MGGAGGPPREHAGVREGRVRAPAQGVARYAPASRFPPPLSPVGAGPPSHSVGGGLPPVQAGLRAETGLLAGLEKGGGGGGGVPGTAGALPPTQLEGATEGGEEGRIGEAEPTGAKRKTPQPPLCVLNDITS